MKSIYNLLGLFLVPLYLIVSAPPILESLNSQFDHANVSPTQKMNQQPDYYNLLPPLNIIKSNKVVDQNPKVSLEMNKEFQALTKEYFNLFNNQFLPFQLFVNRDGFIDNVQIYQKFMSKPISIDPSLTSAFLNNFIGIQLTNGGALKQGRKIAYTTVMAFTVVNDQLILNPILH